ncbi:MAG: SBBP repeat-containing protein, partial [Promethearchaeota archaeon]
MKLKSSSSGFNLVSSWNCSGNGAVCEAMTIDSVGNYYLAGWTQTNNGDSCVLKLAPDGSYIWHAIWGSSGSVDQANDIALDSNGNVYIAGYSDIASPGWIDAILLKYNPLGGLLWQKRWGGPNSDAAK